MASKARIERGCSEKHAAYVQRLVHDVLVYTLPKCGFPETRLPTTEFKDNVYDRADFLDMARASTLRVSLIMRDKWMRMFTSRLNSSGFNEASIPMFLEMVVICCPLSWSSTTQSIVNASLALCNEIIMFFHHEAIYIDINTVINSTSMYITRLTLPNKNVTETIEDLFDKFDNILEYMRWIDEFITNFAIPYGSLEDVSDLFFELVKKQCKEDFKITDSPLTVTKLRDYVGFLPDDFFEIIALEENAVWAEFVLPPETILPDDCRSSSESGAVGGKHCTQSTTSDPFSPYEPPKPLASSESDGVGKKKLYKRRTTQPENVSGETSQSGQSTNLSEVGIGDDLRQMSLSAGAVSQANQGAIPKKKKEPKK